MNYNKINPTLPFYLRYYRMRYLLLFLSCMTTQGFSQDDNCNYILKDGIDRLAVYALDGQAVLVYDTVTIGTGDAFHIEKDWILLPDEKTDTSIITHIDYELSTDTMIRIAAEVPLSKLTCIEQMDTAARAKFVLSVMEEMYGMLSTENGQAGNEHEITLQDYTPGTRSFYYHSFYWAEGYIGRDIIYATGNLPVWHHYLYTISNNLWGDSGEGRQRIAMLFAARPELLLQAFKLINRTANRNYITGSIKDYFGKYLYEPALRFEGSEANRLFRAYDNKTQDERAVLILEYYKPYLQELGLSAGEIQTLLK